MLYMCFAYVYTCILCKQYTVYAHKYVLFSAYPVAIIPANAIKSIFWLLYISILIMRQSIRVKCLCLWLIYSYNRNSISQRKYTNIHLYNRQIKWRIKIFLSTKLNALQLTFTHQSMIANILISCLSTWRFII